jgi:hypothetical protein
MATHGNTEEDHLRRFLVLLLEQTRTMTRFLQATPTKEELTESERRLAQMAVQIELLEQANLTLSKR